MGKMDRSTFLKYQKQYGAGYSAKYDTAGFLYFDANGDGKKDFVAPTSEDASYGAKFDPNLMVYQWDAFGDTTSPYYKKAKPWVAATNDPSTFYQTSWSYNTSVFVFGGGDKATYKLGWTRNDDKGILPNSHIVKDNFNVGFNYTITNNLHATGNANYSILSGYGRAGTGYSGGNLNQNFRQWYQTNVDIKEQKDAFFRTGRNITWNWKDPSTAAGTVPIYTNNYYWTRYMNYETDNRNRLLGNIALNYQPTDWLSFMGRLTVDNYSALQEERVAVGSQSVSSYSRFDIRYNENNYDLMANINKDLSTKLNIAGTVGVNQRKTTYSTVFGQTNGGLVTPLVYALSNSAGTINAPTETYQPIRVDGYYATGTLTYDKFLTIDGAVRKDRFSTLPANNNAATYGGISLGYVFTRHLQVPWITFGKLRMNYATAGNDAAWGSTNFAYDIIGQFGSSLMYSIPSQKSNQNIKAELTKSKAVGLNMAFLHNRVSFDATWYYTNSLNQNIPLAVSTSTGYSSFYLNGGNIRNTGIEILLSGSPIRTPDFSWDVTINWTRNRNKVLDLLSGAQNLQLATSQGGVSINATKGQPYGTIQGKKIIQHNGKDSIKANGYYAVSTTTNNVLGDYNPKWYGGINNSFNFKNVSFSFLIDCRKGSSVFSLDQYYGHMTGVSVESAGLNDLGNPVRNSLANGGGVILDGVVADGSANKQRVVIDANSPAFPVSKFIYDGGFIKLREAVLSYNLPQSVLKTIKGIQNVQFSVFGRNLWIIHKNVPYADPEETLSAGNVQGIQSGAYPTTRSIGVNLKVTF